MTTAIRLVPPVDPIGAPKPVAGDVGSPATARAAVTPEPAPPDTRLVIEEDEDTGAFIYKSLDRVTGEVVRVMPREEVLRLRGEETYTAGDIVAAVA